MNFLSNSGSLKNRISLFNDLALVQLKPGLDVDSVINQLKRNPDVLYAEPNYVVHAFATIPADPDFGELWGLHNTGQTGGSDNADIDAPEGWDITQGSTDVIVAVIDTGVDYNHEDLKNNIWTNTHEIPGNGIDDDKNGYIDDIHGYDFVNSSNT